MIVEWMMEALADARAAGRKPRAFMLGEEALTRLLRDISKSTAHLFESSVPGEPQFDGVPIMTDPDSAYGIDLVV